MAQRPVRRLSKGIPAIGALFLLSLLACAPPQTAPPPLTPRSLLTETQILLGLKSTWRYLDNGSQPPATWTTPAFDDGAWKTGPAQLGYGEGDEATVVGFGPNPRKKFITTYFRTQFDVADPKLFADLIFRVLQDDGAAIYLNGKEIFRENLPDGALDRNTLAPKAAVENLYLQRAVEPTALVAGVNTLAVEVHQNEEASTDLSFDMSITGSEVLFLLRGPYLQLGSPTQATIRWRSDLPTAGWVRYGASPTALEKMVSSVDLTLDHEITLTGLTPGTKYYYSVGTAQGALAGEDESTHFITAPAAGTSKPLRIWAIGDSGRANEEAEKVRDAYRAFTKDRATDVWLMLGDNAYNEGTDDQHQKAVFELYPDLLRKTFVWPALGNHETYGSAILTDIAFLSIFSLPSKAESGGLPSGSKTYYSFDWGDVHFICLDSMTASREPTGPMLTWMLADLKQNQRSWVIAYFHHPPYTKGSHDSDTETELIEMRSNALPILEQYGVDLVLTGHSHSYERSYLIDGHYGMSTTLTPAMKKNGGDGRPKGGGPYRKLTSTNAGRQGTVYAVVGSSGGVSPGFPLDHPVNVVSLEKLGSLVVDIEGARLSATFLREDGTIDDSFVIQKGERPLPPVDAGLGVVAMANVDAGGVVRASLPDAARPPIDARPAARDAATDRAASKGKSNGCTLGVLGADPSAASLSFLAAVFAVLRSRRWVRRPPTR